MIAEILHRRSIRQYLDIPIEMEKLQRIMEAGRWAPTARNLQEWKIVIVNQEPFKSNLIRECASHQPFLFSAPAILAACALNPDYIMRCGHPAYLIDLAIILDQISLQADREGLGTCWIGSFNEENAKRILEIPARARIVELMSLGYPKTIPAPPPKKTLEQLYSFNKW